MELNKENLYNEYIINNKTQDECTKIFNCSKWIIIRALKKYGISKNSVETHHITPEIFNNEFYKKLGKGYSYKGEYINAFSKIIITHKKCGRTYSRRTSQINTSHFCCPYCKAEKRLVITEDELRKLYLVDNFDVPEISNLLKCSKSSIYRAVKRYGLKKTPQQLEESKKKEHIRRSEAKTRYSFDKEKILTLLEEGITLKQMASIFKCSCSAVGNYIAKNNLTSYRNYDIIKENKKMVLKENLLNKYGVVNVMDVPEFREKSILNKSDFHISKPEIELREYIESIYDGEVKRYHDGIYELDIYIPDKNLGIEYNGTYWHSALNKDKNYHFNKSSYFETKGIRVIHVFEYEWENDRQRPILENIIKSALGINEQKIYARKCSIEVRKSSDMKSFFENNNIQGFRGGKFSICLVYEGEVVMAYMMGHCYFGKGKYQWEVIRGATKLGYTVVGGASKIWKYFLKEYNPDNCVYYIDYNYFNGSSLPYLGLTYIKSQPGFKNWWVKEGIVKNREPNRHKEITALYKSGEVVPIYNAGTKVYVWIKS